MLACAVAALPENIECSRSHTSSYSNSTRFTMLQNLCYNKLPICDYLIIAQSLLSLARFVINLMVFINESL